MAIEQHLTFFIGEDKLLEVSVLDEDGAPQDITGWSLSWMVKRRKTQDDEDALIVHLSDGSPAGVTIPSPLLGRCNIEVVDADTVDLRAGLYYHELKRLDPGGEAVLFYGSLKLVRGVHHA